MAVCGLRAMRAGCLRRRQRKAYGGLIERARLACASPCQPPIQFAANNTKDAGESPPRDGRCLQEGGRRVYAEAFRKAVLVRRRLHRDIVRHCRPGILERKSHGTRLGNWRRLLQID